MVSRSYRRPGGLAALFFALIPILGLSALLAFANAPRAAASPFVPNAEGVVLGSDYDPSVGNHSLRCAPDEVVTGTRYHACHDSYTGHIVVFTAPESAGPTPVFSEWTDLGCACYALTPGILVLNQRVFVFLYSERPNDYGVSYYKSVIRGQTGPWSPYWTPVTLQTP